MQYLMKLATLSTPVGRMHTANGLKMALPHSGTSRFVANSPRNSVCKYVICGQMGDDRDAGDSA